MGWISADLNLTRGFLSCTLVSSLIKHRLWAWWKPLANYRWRCNQLISDMIVLTKIEFTSLEFWKPFVWRTLLLFICFFLLFFFVLVSSNKRSCLQSGITVQWHKPATFGDAEIDHFKLMVSCQLLKQLDLLYEQRLCKFRSQSFLYPRFNWVAWTTSSLTNQLTYCLTQSSMQNRSLFTPKTTKNERPNIFAMQLWRLDSVIFSIIH